MVQKKKEEKDKDGKVDKDKEDKEDDDTELKRFILLNFRGIYNFEFNNNFDCFDLNEKFEYLQSIRRELDNWYTNTDDYTDTDDCMKRLLSCIYNKYFLVT